MMTLCRQRWVASMLLLASGSSFAQTCIPAHTFVEMTADVGGLATDAYGKNHVPLGQYERISPDGRFVLRSYSGAKLGNVSVMELPAQGDKVVRGYRTPLRNEAFPVQGTWRYLVDIDGSHYRLQDILQQGEQARALFKGGMTGFYAAAAELPGQQPGQIIIRSLSWPNAGSSDDSQGVGTLSVRSITVDTAQQRKVADTGVQYLCANRVQEDGAMYALPMISVDGKEFAAMPLMPADGKQTMRIFGFGESGKDCHLRAALPHASGKTVFGFNHGQGADLAYEYRGEAWWYNRAAGQAFNISMPPMRAGETLTASAFPGITRDGRVIYAASWRHCQTGQGCSTRVGYVVSDPYQSAAWQAWRAQHPNQAQGAPSCITQEAVAQSRRDFARLHGLAE